MPNIWSSRSWLREEKPNSSIFCRNIQMRNRSVKTKAHRWSQAPAPESSKKSVWSVRMAPSKKFNWIWATSRKEREEVRSHPPSLLRKSMTTHHLTNRWDPAAKMNPQRLRKTRLTSLAEEVQSRSTIRRLSCLGVRLTRMASQHRFSWSSATRLRIAMANLVS